MKNMIALVPSVFLVACLGQNENSSVNVESETTQQVVSTKSAPQFSVSLTEKRNPDIESVIINVKHLEIYFSKKDKEVRYLLGTQLGSIDLLNINQGLELSLAEFKLPAGSRINQIRLILENEGNHLIFKDGTTCELKTPSAQQSGLKIINLNQHSFSAGKNYSLSLVFDTNKNIVLLGNGGCLLKPVLKNGGLSESDSTSNTDPVVVIPEDNSPSESNEEEPTENPTPDDSGAATDDSTGDDEWDYTPIVDGVPTLIP